MSLFWLRNGFSILSGRKVYSDPLDEASLSKLIAAYERSAEEGEAEAKRLIAAFPGSAHLCRLLAHSALRHDDRLAALAYASVALSLDSDNPIAYHLLAVVLEKNGLTTFTETLRQLQARKYELATGSKFPDALP